MLHFVKMYHAEIIQQDLQLDCQLIIRIPLANYAMAIDAWKKMRTADVLDEKKPLFKYD